MSLRDVLLCCALLVVLACGSLFGQDSASGYSISIQQKQDTEAAAHMSRAQLITDLKLQLASGALGHSKSRLKFLDLSDGLLTIVQCMDGIPLVCNALEASIQFLEPRYLQMSGGGNVVFVVPASNPTPPINFYSTFAVEHSGIFSLECPDAPSSLRAAAELVQLIALDKLAGSPDSQKARSLLAAHPGRARAVINAAYVAEASDLLKQGQVALGAALLLEASRDGGDGSSSLRLGSMYENGPELKQNIGKAEDFYKKALEQGEYGAVPALDRLAAMYSSGQNVPKDLSHAAELYGVTAAKGDPTGLVELGAAYGMGAGVPVDLNMSRSLFERAAAQNDPFAFTVLGNMYQSGNGVQKDYQRARNFYNQALKFCNTDDLRKSINANLQVLDQRAASDQAAPQQVAMADLLQQTVDTNNSERIAQLRLQIESNEQEANSLEESANELARNANCSPGPGAAMCQMIGNAGAAKQRKDANKARNEADRDREEIQRLQGEDVTAHQRRTTSFGDTFTQAVNQQSANASYPPTVTYPVPASTATASSTNAAQNHGGAPALQAPRSVPAPNAPPMSISSTTASIPPSAVSSTTATPAEALVPPRDNTCIARFYDPKFYNWLSMRNDCSEPVHLTYQSRQYPSAVFGASDITVGQVSNTGHSQSEVDSAGGIVIYVCPINYVPVDEARHPIGSSPPVARFACQPQ